MKLIQIIGNLGQEPKLRTSANGRELMTFSVAVTNKDKTTTWFNIVANKMQGILPYLTKGRQLYVLGELELKTYKGEIDATIFAEIVQLCGGKDETTNNPPTPTNNPPTPQNPPTDQPEIVEVQTY